MKPITKGIAGKVDSSFMSPNLKTHLDFLEDQLATSSGGREFFCGKELTGRHPDDLSVGGSHAEGSN